MGNLMTSIYVGVSGLTTSQTGLNTTAHNLANVDTKGYVRQQALIKDFTYNTVGSPTNISSKQVGIGSDMAVIRQVRDQFLDKAYRLEIGRQGFYEKQFEAVTEMEDLFGELEGVEFQSSLNSIWGAVQELAKEPDSIAARSSLIQRAVSFAERAENISKQLGEYQQSLNLEVENTVNRINEIGKEIGQLNIEIQKYLSSGQQPNDYRDRRNALLDELGQMVKISYDEDIKGMLTVNIEGRQFVQDNQVHKLETEPYQIPVTYIDEDDEEVQEYVPSTMLNVVWEGNNEGSLYPNSMAEVVEKQTDVGALKGLLMARGNYQASYIDIPIKPEEETFMDEDGELDEDAYNEAMLDYEKQLEDYKENVQPSIIMSTQAKFDQLIHGVVTTINDILCPNIKVTVDGEEAWILDPDKAPVGMDENQTPGEALFNRKSMDRYRKEEVTVDFEDGRSETMEVYIYNEENPLDIYSRFTLGEIEVNPEIMKNYSLLPLSDKENTGDYDIEVCKKLLDAWDTKFSTLGPETDVKNNFLDYYTSLIGDLANRGEVMYTISKNQADEVTNIDNQRSSISGVSSDEEITNLIKFQHAYNANSRYINVVNEMLEQIIMRMA